MARVYGNTVTVTSGTGNTVKWRAWADYSISTSTTAGVKATVGPIGVDIISANNSGNGSQIYWAADSMSCSIEGTSVGTWPSGKLILAPAGDRGTFTPGVMTITSANYSFSYANYTAARGVSISVVLKRETGTWQGETVATISITVPALPQYAVRYFSNGGSGSGKQYSVVHNTTHVINSASAASIGLKTGYTFQGWARNTAATVAAYTPGQSLTVTENYNLYAVWKINSYTLTANANNGSISTSTGWSGSGTSVSKTINYGTKYDPLPNNPTRAAYSFAGWYTAASGGTQVTKDTTMGAAATTIYAHWSALGYTITYDYQGGTVSKANTSSYNVETATFTLTNPTRTGYNFTGWTVNTAPTAWGSGSVHDGGTTFTIGRGTYGNIKVTAKWTEKTANLTYNATGINGTLPSPNPQLMSYTAATTLKAATAPTGYSFYGWATSDANAKAGTRSYTGTATYKNANVVPAAATLYATWYGTITYYANGHGTAPAATKMYYTSSNNAAAALSATGYTFNGWNTNSGGTGTSYAAGGSVKNANEYKANINLYAQWTANRYDISLNNNGATSAGTTIYYQKYNTGIYSNLGCTETFPNNKITPPTRTGYTFGGYYDGSTQYIDASGTILANSTTFTSNKTLVAKWTVNSYVLTANVNVGSSISPGPTITTTSGWTIASGSKTATKSINYGATYGTLPTLSNWNNHTFKGWYTTSTGNTTVTSNTTMGAAATTIYAQWTGNKTVPSISDLLIQRVDENGDPLDEGTYCHISFTASPGITYSDTDNTSTLGSTNITISCKIRGSNTSVTITNSLEACTTNNKPYSFMVTNNNSNIFDEDKIYDFTITLTNGTNHLTTTRTDYLSAAYFPMDFSKNAKALGIFRTAPDDQEGLFVGDKPAFFQNTINGFTINTDTTTLNADSISTSGIWLSKSSITNAATTNWGVLFNDINGTKFQLFIPDSSYLYVYKRYYSNSTWSSWSKLSAGYADSAGSATNADKLNNYASDTAASANTIVRRDGSGYIRAVYFNQSSGAETPTSSSYWIFANSDGWFRKSTRENLEKTIYPYEAKLQWGGQNYAGSSGPLDAAMINDLGANRFAFAKAAGITVEYSRDNGANWTDYGLTDVQKVGLFSNGYSTSIGKADSTNKATANGTNYQLRVTLSTSAASIYTEIRKFAIYVSTNGSNGSTVTIQRALENTPTTFVNVATDVSLSGWSGWNIINVSPFTTYGNTATTQNGRVRFIFKANGGSTTYTGLQVSKIQAYGGVGWTTPSTMALTGHLYSYDSSQNATFPAQITATQFNGSLNGRALKLKDYTNNNDTWLDYGAPGLDSCTYLGAWNGYRLGAIKPEKLTVGSASTATKATQDGSGNTITSTYVKKSGDTLSGNLWVKTASGEGNLGVNHSTDGSGSKKLYLWGNVTSGTRGLYDSTKGYVIQVTDSTTTFTGSLSGNATSATSATSATYATSATSAVKATQDGDGANIASTYLKKSDLHGKFINEVVSLDNITINANSSKTDISISAAKSGYTPIAVGGWSIDNASSSGANCHYCVPYRIRLNGTNVVASIKCNTSSNAAKIRLYVYVTYVSNS